jgi:hypothetical protein
MELPNLGRLCLVPTGVIEAEAPPPAVDDNCAGLTAKETKSEFFTVDDFQMWKQCVLSFLSQPTSPIHNIVNSGHLPIFSKKNNVWFGVTAECRFIGQNVPEDEWHESYDRLQLSGLLTSDKPMNPSKRHVLQDHSSSSFNLLYLDDLVLGQNQDKTEPRLYLQSLYPRRSSLDGLTGGDLLCATAIIFALTRVRYLMVGEGPDLHNFEKKHVPNGPKYFYYNKFILGKAQHVKRAKEDKDLTKRKRRNAEMSTLSYYEPLPQFFEIVEEREADRIMQFWLWESSLWKPTAEEE